MVAKSSHRGGGRRLLKQSDEARPEVLPLDVLPVLLDVPPLDVLPLLDVLPVLLPLDVLPLDVLPVLLDVLPLDVLPRLVLRRVASALACWRRSNSSRSSSGLASGRALPIYRLCI
jgi:hypothetical protein